MRNDSQDKAWEIHEGDGPLVATAIHSGHEIRDELQPWLALSEEDRLREEDPYTGRWVAVGDTSVVVHRSRFEVDLNRPREKAVYRSPKDAWGLKVWKDDAPDQIFEQSFKLHEDFYVEIRALLEEKLKKQEKIVLYDLHSYNHRREGPEAPSAPAEENPEVNVGTGAEGLPGWRPVVEAFLDSLSSYEFQGRKLDVRENVKFKGGYFSRWILEQFPDRVCVLAIEFKKFFMDEWTGAPDRPVVDEIGRALESTKAPVMAALGG
jgi:N-formylglutamate deformylase